MNTESVASILAAGGHRLGPDAMVFDVTESVHLPHAVLDVEAVVADAGLLAVLYHQRVEGDHGVFVHVRRGKAFGGCAWSFRDHDGEVLVHVTLNPEQGPEPLRFWVSETRVGRVPQPYETGTAELDLPPIPWEGRSLGSVAVGPTEIEVDQCAFGGLGGRARLQMRGNGAVAAIVNERFREVWLPSPGASAPLDSADGVEVPPQKPDPRLHAAWASDFSVVARTFPPRPESRGMGSAGRAHGWVTDPNSPTLTDVVAFDYPTEGRVQLVCTPIIWDRIVPVLFDLSPEDAGRCLRVRGRDGLALQVAVFGQAEPGHLEWAARAEGHLPLRLGLLERRPEGERAGYGEWQAVPSKPDSDGWQRIRSRLIGPERRAEIACVAKGAPGPSVTLGTRPRTDTG